MIIKRGGHIIYICDGDGCKAELPPQDDLKRARIIKEQAGWLTMVSEQGEFDFCQGCKERFMVSIRGA